MYRDPLNRVHCASIYRLKTRRPSKVPFGSLGGEPALAGYFWGVAVEKQREFEPPIFGDTHVRRAIVGRKLTAAELNRYPSYRSLALAAPPCSGVPNRILSVSICHRALSVRDTGQTSRNHSQRAGPRLFREPESALRADTATTASLVSRTAGRDSIACEW